MNGRCRRRCWWGTEYRLPDHMFLDAVPSKSHMRALTHFGTLLGLFLARPPSPKPQTLQPQRGDPETR